MRRIFGFLALACCVALLWTSHARAADGGVCPRPPEGSVVKPPPDLYSSNGVLRLAFHYKTAVDRYGRTLFCFDTAKGLESPTLHVNPGDTIEIALTDDVPPVQGGPSEIVSNKSNVCGDAVMTLSSVNIHFHGMNVSPKCHGDEVIHTLVNPGETFQYKIKVPKDEPPGLYWYHPHVHGISSAAVHGGASGIIEVEGIQNLQPIVAGLPERILVVRDEPLQVPVIDSLGLGPAPYWDISLNYITVAWPTYTPAIIRMKAGGKEFWRVANAAANTILDLQVVYDGKAQPLQIVALDGVPTGSQDGKRQGTVITRKHILIPPAGRAEFVITGPPGSVKKAILATRKIDGGPASDNNPARPIAAIETTGAPLGLPAMPRVTGAPGRQRFEDLNDAKVTAHRKLYFSEAFAVQAPPGNGKRPPDSDKQMLFFITVDGQIPTVFDPNNPPAIVTHRGAVEDWTIENRTTEVHEFHIHQIHFELLAVNGKPVGRRERQFYDTYQVGYWDGVSKTYPSIKVRMDFRGAVVGDFVYHCHILDHEDGGMMAIIRVKPPK